MKAIVRNSRFVDLLANFAIAVMALVWDVG